MPTPDTRILAQAVHAQFAARPTLRSVTTQMLADNLRDKYPPLTLPASALYLAHPRDGGGRALAPLVEVALTYLADGSLPDLSTRGGLDAYLSDASGTRLVYEAQGSRAYDLTVIQDAIRELPLILHVGFQEALSVFWSEDDGSGNTRWQWLAGVLQGVFRGCTINQPGTDPLQLRPLTSLVRYPARETRNRQAWPGSAVHAYCVETRLEHDDVTLTLQGSEILIVSGERVWLYSLPGQLEAFASLQAFGLAWGERMAQRYSAEKITWRQYEPDGDLFEVQAALVLNQQLEDLAAFDLRVQTTPIELAARLAALTDPAPLFIAPGSTPAPSLEAVRAALPDWLKNASTADRLAYRQCLLEQASLQRLNPGERYLDGIETLRSFAAKRLNQQLCRGRNAALNLEETCTDDATLAWRAEDLQLVFKVAIGTLQGGYLETVTMSLVDLALKNLAGKPSGNVTLRHRERREIEAWLTTDYLMQMIEQVDIGRYYPAYLREHLLDDNPQAQKRQQLFIQQCPVQLKTLALEYKIKGEGGLTRRGFQCVSAVVEPVRAQRCVGDDEIIMRVLAFRRKPDAHADVVQNMFIIEPRNADAGPHVLYRPAYAQSLLEFASREQLLNAIAAPGELQDSVLTWLPDNARAIYSNGGFTEPHIIRFSLGSESDVLPGVPSPATLAPADDRSAGEILGYLSNGRLMEYLFGSEARQLVDLAQRQSTSSAQSRWAHLLEGVQLGFNTLLVVIRGPLAAAAWMLQLTQSLSQDLPALQSDDPVARELAWVDVLLNIGMLLVHQGQASEAMVETEHRAQTLAQLPLRRRLGDPVSHPQAQVHYAGTGVPSEPPGGGRTPLDFDRSLASDSASARLLEKLLAVSRPWPKPAPAAVDIGPFQGLYRIDSLWHASVGGLLFRVSIVPGVGEVFIIHPQKTDHPGIKLKTDGKGHWTLDRGLKLQGGGPKRIAALREENREKTRQLINRAEALNAEITPQMATLRESMTRMEEADQALARQGRVLNVAWNLMDQADVQQRPALQARHTQEMQRHSAARAQFEILMQTLIERFEHTSRLRQEAIQVGRDLEKFGGARMHVQERAKMLKLIWEQQFVIHTYLRNWTNSLLYSNRGEPTSHLGKRMLVSYVLGDPTAYNEHVSRSIEMADALERMGQLASEMETTLDQLEQDSGAGRAIRQDFLAMINPSTFFNENMRLRALSALAGVTAVVSDSRLPPQEALYVKRLNSLDIHQAVQSHIAVRSSDGFPLDEQRNVYESLLGHYNEYENGIQALKAINPLRLPSSSERFLQSLRYAQALAQNELESVVRKQEALAVELPLSKTLRAKAPTTKVFRTRGKDYLVGDFKLTDAQEEQVTITDAFTTRALTTFKKSGDGWAQVVEKDPDAPVTSPPKIALATLREQGRGLINQRAAIEQVISAQQSELDDPVTRQAINPADWEELLGGQARELDAVADELAHHYPEASTDLIEEFRVNARDMQRKAVQVCSAAYKRQWPTQAGIEYLWRNQQIDINLTSLADPQRPTLRGDFFTEYAVYDKVGKPPKVLWYAHFHYATAQAPAAAYTRAHLKLPEQRKFTQKDLLKEHVQQQLQAHGEPGAVPLRSIVYALISPPVDQLFLAIAPRP